MNKYFLIALLLSVSCGQKTGDQNKVTEIKESEAKTTLKSKLEIFNDIDGTRKLLSKVGIGELGNWRDDEMGGYMSITNYFPFGTNNVNNLALYLLSDNPDNIRTLEIVLNINNDEKKEALRKLLETSQKTFDVLNINFPDELSKAIKEETPITMDKETFSIELKLEKSRIATWTVKIETRK